jgi:hypothetical protein
MRNFGRHDFAVMKKRAIDAVVSVYQLRGRSPTVKRTFAAPAKRFGKMPLARAGTNADQRKLGSATLAAGLLIIHLEAALRATASLALWFLIAFAGVALTNVG